MEFIGRLVKHKMLAHGLMCLQQCTVARILRNITPAVFNADLSLCLQEALTNLQPQTAAYCLTFTHTHSRTHIYTHKHAHTHTYQYT